MSSSSKTLSPMEEHQESSFSTKFNTNLITGTCKITLTPHRWSSKSKLQKDISNLTPSKILDLPLSNFGLCNIPSINQFMKELDISPAKQNAVNELFKIKYATNMYPDDVNEEAMILISKTKLYRIKKNEEIKAVKDKEWEDFWGERYKLAELGISTKPSAVDASTVATTPADEMPTTSGELSFEERLAAIRKAGGSRSVKRRKTHRRKSIKRRGTRKRRGTKRKLRKSKK